MSHKIVLIKKDVVFIRTFYKNLFYKNTNALFLAAACSSVSLTFRPFLSLWVCLWVCLWDTHKCPKKMLFIYKRQVYKHKTGDTHSLMWGWGEPYLVRAKHQIWREIIPNQNENLLFSTTYFSGSFFLVPRDLSVPGLGNFWMNPSPLLLLFFSLSIFVQTWFYHKLVAMHIRLPRSEI